MKVKSPLTKTEVKQSQYAFRDELSLFEKALNPSQKQLSLFKKCPSALEKIVLHFLILLKSATIIQYTIKGRFMSR